MRRLVTACNRCSGAAAAALLLALLLGSATPPAAASPPPPTPPAREFAPGRVIVQLRPTLTTGVAAASFGGATKLSASQHGVALRQALGAPASSGSGTGTGSAARRLAASASGGTAGPGVYAILDGSSVTDKVAQLKELPEVAWAVPDYRWYLPEDLAAAASAAGEGAAGEGARAPGGSAGGGAGGAAAGGSSAGGQPPAGEQQQQRRRLRQQQGRRRLAQGGSFIPNDEGYPGQWHLPAVSAPQAWARTDGVGAPVCVIDGGMATDHPDLPTRASQHPCL